MRQLREKVEQYTGPSTAHVTFGRRPRRPDRGAGADAGREAEAGRGWPGLLRGRWRRDDRESLVCYALYAGVFVADMSLLALAFPAALYLYALLVNPPSPRFWQARALLYITFSILPSLYYLVTLFITLYFITLYFNIYVEKSTLAPGSPPRTRCAVLVDMRRRGLAGTTCSHAGDLL